jgi:hypothetical protein
LGLQSQTRLGGLFDGVDSWGFFFDNNVQRDFSLVYNLLKQGLKTYLSLWRYHMHMCDGISF